MQASRPPFGVAGHSNRNCKHLPTKWSKERLQGAECKPRPTSSFALLYLRTWRASQRLRLVAAGCCNLRDGHPRCCWRTTARCRHCRRHRPEHSCLPRPCGRCRQQATHQTRQQAGSAWPTDWNMVSTLAGPNRAASLPIAPPKAHKRPILLPPRPCSSRPVPGRSGTQQQRRRRRRVRGGGLLLRHAQRQRPPDRGVDGTSRA